jgi:hypothetical protein
MLFGDTLAWWTALRGVAVLNAALWLSLAVWAWRQRGQWPPDTWLSRRAQLLLSAGYVLGCAWRSWLPVYDVPRLVLVDSWWSSVIVGRSVATVAELCFVAQWALLLRQVSKLNGSRFALAVSGALLPLIALAEMFSWHAVLTTSNLGHMVEESLWGLCAVMVALCLLMIGPKAAAHHRPWLLLWALSAAAYAVYMFGVDVPMYATRWLADEASGRDYLSLSQGLADVASHWVVTHSWDIWRGEVLWMTAYFSLAVWISLALVLVPRLSRQPDRPQDGRRGTAAA